jgi:DUF4097 and DUF4098 domain-containing protein YvlB
MSAYWVRPTLSRGWLPAVFFLAAPGLWADQWVKTFTPTGRPELSLEAAEAAITIVGEDRRDIEARVTTAGWKISGNGVQVRETGAGNLLQLEVVTPEINLAIARHAVKVELKVPRDIDCDLKAGLGAVTVTGVNGKIVLVAKTGTITLLDINGKLEATTGEGKIRARGRFDQLTLMTGYGAVDMEAAAGSRMFGEWRISTDAGNVTLHLPANFSADLDAQADAGHITVDLPYTVTGTPDQGSIRGKMNAGGEALVLRTSGGSIKVLAK